MDELTLLRELGDDPPALAPAGRTAALMRLRREMVREGRPPPRRTRGVVAVAVVAAAVAGIIALDNDREWSGRAPAATELASARARDALHLAARRSLIDVPAAAIPRGDQFVYIREVLEETPADRPGKPRRFVDELWCSVDGSQPSRVSERGRSWMEPPWAHRNIWPPRGYAELERLPTDPAALRRALRGSPTEDHEAEYMYLYFLLTGRRLMPPGLQAAAFRALAQIPGVDVVDDAVNLRGRRGIGITRGPDPLGDESMLILDRETHDYLGTRTEYLTSEGERVVQLTARVEQGIVDRIGERPPGG